MAYKIVITEQAKEDTQAAYNYYEDQRNNLGEEFLGELIKRYGDLEDHPENYGYIDNRGILRDVKIDRFPYVIVFEKMADTVVIYAVHNTFRHPKRKLPR